MSVGLDRKVALESKYRATLLEFETTQAADEICAHADEEGHRIMGACPPEQTTTLQLIQSFVRYARAHRTELQGNAVLAVFRALREAHPCRAEHGD